MAAAAAAATTGTKAKETAEGRLRMENAVVNKVIREVSKKEQKDLMATDVARVVAAVAARDDNWLKNASHWADTRTLQSIRSKVRNDVDSSKVLGVTSNAKAATREATAAAPEEEWTVRKKKGGPNTVTTTTTSTAWIDMKLDEGAWTVPVINQDDVGYDAEGIAMVTFTKLKEYVKTVRSAKVLVLAVPGELDPSTLKDKSVRELLVDVRHEVCKLVMTDQLSQACTKSATLFSIGADAEYRKPPAQAEMKFNGDAMRELAAAAVLEYMKDADKKKIKNDPKYVFKKMLEQIGLTEKERGGVDLHSFRCRGEEVEVMCNARKEITAKILSQQRAANGCGIFFRECVRTGGDASKAPVVWFPAGTSLGEALSKADRISKTIPLAWARSRGLGIRTESGGDLRKARGVILSEGERPIEQAMEIKGEQSWIIENLPFGFDHEEIMRDLAAWGWPVLAGRHLRSKTAMRVLADSAPKKKIIPSGGLIPYTLRLEFPEVGTKMEAQKLKPARDLSKQEGEGGAMETDHEELQEKVDKQMQDFLNGGDRGTATESSPDGSSHSKAAQGDKGGNKEEETAESKSFKASMEAQMQMFAKSLAEMQGRQMQAEQRQADSELQMRAAVAEIRAEQSAAKASTSGEIADVKTILEQMARQQAQMMAVLQADDRRVKPKVEA
jgi:hypothetical protein